MINRRDFIRRTGCGAAALMVGCSTGPSSRVAADKRPNLVIIMADDLSAMQLGCYGNPDNRTPNLDRLAAEGVHFETCWATPVCSPSRAMIYTGRYACRTGWYHNDLKPSRPLYDDHLTLPQPLKKAGYRTAFCGKWQMPGTPEKFGFDEHLTNVFFPKDQQMPSPVGDDGRYSFYWHPALIKNNEIVPTGPEDYAPDLAADFVVDFAAQEKDTPFFIFYSMWLPHVAYDSEHGKWGYPSPPMTDEAGNRVPGKNRKGNAERTLEGQGTLVEYIDILVGRIARGLKKEGLLEDTIIFFTADNGAPQYGKNRPDAERGARVPMIVYNPARVKIKGSSPALVSFADVLPTLVQLGGAETHLPKDYELDGISFVPVLEGSTKKTRDTLFSNLGSWQMLRDDRWLLDAAGTFWDTGGRRDEIGYKDVTLSDDPEVKKARDRFNEYLEKYPTPSEQTEGWQTWMSSSFRENITKNIESIQSKRDQRSGASVMERKE